MDGYKQVRRHQVSLFTQFEKVESLDEFFNNYRNQFINLNKEFIIAEKVLYDELDNKSMSLISLDKEILSLKSNNLELSNKIKLLEMAAKNAKTYNIKLIKKDKIIHKLKKSIKSNFLDFGKNMLPKSYLRISKQFPHLSIEEIIEFEKK
jgi:hypothetical protein